MGYCVETLHISLPTPPPCVYASIPEKAKGIGQQFLLILTTRETVLSLKSAKLATSF